MLISQSDLGRRKPGFAWWRMLAWVLLLGAAYSGLQYIHFTQLTWAILQALPASDSQDAASVHKLLTWYIGSLVACFVVVVVCAGGILRQAWARPALRVVALVLCAWAVYRGFVSWQQWSASAQTVAALSADVQAMRHAYLIELVLWTIAVPAMLWLVWQLGHPAVRLQFRSRRG
jgi:hypothetical protein